MLPWTRPDKHQDFDIEAQALLGKIRKAVEGRAGKLHSGDFDGKHLWNASWQRGAHARGLHKQTLVGASPEYAKCAWCERILRWKTELDVEHYRPKAWVTRWDGDPPLVSDVGPEEIDIGQGYWWLAFAWENYSLACGPCNRDFKRNLFPVVEPRPACLEGVELIERPLLLDPGSAFRVRDHFRWEVDGTMGYLSPEGRATIITCGLNRRDLCALRLKVASETRDQVGAFLTALRLGDERGQKLAYAKLAALGARTSEFTSMIRWLVEESLGCAWDELEGMPT